MKRLAILVCLSASLLASAVQAHFKLNQNVRIYHVVHSETGLDIYLRMPMSFLVADRVGRMRDDGRPEPAPYTTNALEAGRLVHRVDPDALRADPAGLGQIAERSLVVRSDGRRMSGEILSIRIVPTEVAPGFATRAEAETALSLGETYPDVAPAYVGDTMVDLHLRYIADTTDRYSLASTAAPGLDGQAQTANLILDYRGDVVRTYRATGLMADPVEVSGSAATATSTFVVEGIRHILEGADHVLFVICMIIGAQGLRSLMLRVTGFTLGHTVTLILGFFGIAPSGSWFIPTVELAIAVSIVYAAAMACFGTGREPDGDRRAMAITSGIGLLHGFGFSFMLHNILQVDAPNVWQSLLAFNIGVEIGQLAVVLAAWPAVLALRAMQSPFWLLSRTAVAGSAMLVALFWSIERTGALLGTSV